MGLLFIWMETLGKILTCDNLIKRAFLSLIKFCYLLKKKMVGVVFYTCMCWYGGEIVNHRWIHCTVACDLWSFVFRLFGIIGIHWVLLEKLGG